MSKAYSINIFFPGGDPDGLRLITKPLWTGEGLVIPRAAFSEGRKCKELERVGVYVLVGPPEDSGLPRIYVGEAGKIRRRLDKHAAKRDFWTICVVFTSNDNILNAAHVKHLEARMIGLAKETKRCTLDNRNAPASLSLSQADAAYTEGFLDEMLLCFRVLGLSMFSTATVAPERGRTLYLSGKGVKAKGRESGAGFVVLTGSTAVRVEEPHFQGHLSELRATLVANGVMRPAGAGGFIFAQDYVFQSASAAAGVVLGRSSNGRIEWKANDGKTLKQLDKEAANA